jgi:Aspartyl protease
LRCTSHMPQILSVRNMKVSIMALLILAANVAARPQQPSPEPGSRRSLVPFELNQSFGSIIVKAQVNGHPATLVVDTGSSNTILSSDLLQIQPLAVQPAYAPSKGSGFTGTAAWAKATLEIGAFRWPDRKLLVMSDFHDLSHSMKQKVDGILGQDVLREFDSIAIDFKHRCLILR